jgi:hypothetical protein
MRPGVNCTRCVKTIWNRHVKVVVGIVVGGSSMVDAFVVRAEAKLSSRLCLPNTERSLGDAHHIYPSVAAGSNDCFFTL